MPPQNNNNKKGENPNNQNTDNNDNNNNPGTKKAGIVLAIAILITLSISAASYYRENFSNKNNKNTSKKKFCSTCAGEELAYFAQRLRAEVVSENVGLVEHDRVGGFSLQIQSNTAANTSLVGVPISSCISIPELMKVSSSPSRRRRGNNNNQKQQKDESDDDDDDDNDMIQYFFQKTKEFKKTEFENNKKEWLTQLGATSASSSSSLDQQKDAIWEQIQLVSFLIRTRQLCKSQYYEENIGVDEHKNNITTSSFYHWCPWMNHIVIPSTNNFLPLSDFRWRPEITARCLRQSQRLQYEGTLLQVSVMSNIILKLLSSSSTSTSTSHQQKNSMAEIRPLVEWALFVIRTRGHQLPTTGDTIIVPLLDMNDKRVGAHLYRKSSKQAPTSVIVFDEQESEQIDARTAKKTRREKMAQIITTERHIKGAYPLTAPGSWSSTSPSAQPSSILQQYGTVPHALPLALQKKIYTSPINLKKEVENTFGNQHFFSVPLTQQQMSSKDKRCKQMTRLSFNVSSGELHPNMVSCMMSSSSSSEKDNADENNSWKNSVKKELEHASITSVLSPEALFACRSVAAKQKEGFITDKIRILGGKQAQALIDLDEMVLNGAEKAKRRYS